MSDQQELRVVYISKPTNVESVVPEQQKLRDPLADADKSQNSGDQSDNVQGDDSTFVQVFTTKKEEAVYTKGDLKLQKVSVSEDVSKNKIANPMYSEIHSEVIKNEQPVRTIPKHAQSDEEPAINKPKSKIPMLQHKTENLRQDTDETKTRKAPSRKLRRSSIPKLKKVEAPLNKETEKKSTDKPNRRGKIHVQSTTNDNDKSIVQPEEEFDKIFDEIIHNDGELILNTNELVDDFEDAEKLEYSFEEIIHNYEENKIQPMDIKQIKSKKPLVKQKSLPEEKFSKKLERRLSLKDIPTNNNDNTRKASKKDVKIKSNRKSFNKKYGHLHENEELKPKKIDINIKNSTKLETSKQRNLTKLVSEMNQTNKVATPVLQADDGIKEESNKLEQKFIIVEDSEKYEGEESVKRIIEKSLEDKDSSHIKETPKDIFRESGEIAATSESKKNNVTNIPNLQGKVSLLTSKFSYGEKSSIIQPPKLENSNKKPNKWPIISKIAVLDKNPNTETNKSYDNAKQDNHTVSKEICGSNEEISNVLSNGQVIVKEQSHKETDLSNKALALDDVGKDKEDIDKTSILAAKIRRNSNKKLKLERSESTATGIGNPLHIKQKICLNNATPPNTPQIYDYEPYKDSAHLAGEPKILNTDINETQKNEYRNKNSVNLIVPRHESNQFDNINQHTIDAQNINTQQSNVPKQSSRDIHNQIDYDKNQGIDFNSPNPDEYDRAPLFEAVNKKLNAEIETNESGEEIFSIKGKVSKIITRIDSIDVKPLDTAKKQNNVDLPLKKSVSTRIAMFERQVSMPSETKPKLKLLLDTKPRIIEEVLKAQPPRKTTWETESHKSNKLKHEIDSGEPLKIGKIDDNIIYSKDIEHVANVVEIQDSVVSDVQHGIFSHTSDNFNVQGDIINLNENDTTLSIHKENKFDVVSKPSNHRVYSDKLLQDNENQKSVLYKSKSVAELDLGDAVKGKVQQMIVRMNSFEIIELEKKLDNINDRERPRKKSVSEKIALFEKKNLMRSSKNLDKNGVIRLTENAETAAAIRPIENAEVQAAISLTKNAEMAAAIRLTENAEEQAASSLTKNQELAAAAIRLAENDEPQAASSLAKNAETSAAIRLTDNVEAEAAIRCTKNQELEAAIRLSDNAEASINKTQPESTPIPDPTTDDQYKQRIEALQKTKQNYGKMDNMMYIKLKNGQDMPVLFLGTALMDPTLLPYIFSAAIDMGYRGIDTAFIYGNEKEIGQAIKAKIDDGTIKREELFITGKLWSTFHRQDLVEKACSASLEALGLEYFDMYLIHNPMSFKEGGSPIPMIANVLQYSDTDYLQAWYGMEGLVEKGLAKGIGLSNFNSEQVAKVVSKGKIKPVVNQVECHPYLTQQRLDQFCADRDITLQCFGTLGSKSTPAEYKSNQDAVIDDPMVRIMAAGLNITPAQLLLRYQIECGHSIVTKSSSAERLWDNLQAQAITLSAAQVDALHALNRNKRTYMFKGMGDTHRNYPFKIPY